MVDRPSRIITFVIFTHPFSIRFFLQILKIEKNKSRFGGLSSQYEKVKSDRGCRRRSVIACLDGQRSICARRKFVWWKKWCAEFKLSEMVAEKWFHIKKIRELSGDFCCFVLENFITLFFKHEMLLSIGVETIFFINGKNLYHLRSNVLWLHRTFQFFYSCVSSFFFTKHAFTIHLILFIPNI